MEEGTYSDIGSRLKGYIDNKFIDPSKLKSFFHFLLKNQNVSSAGLILDKDLEIKLTNQFETLGKLIFGVEIKRNPAALLTNAMFFDLVDQGVYKIEDIDKKMPMSMKDGAVPGSVTIDKKVSGYLTSLSAYDYRNKEEKSKAEEVVIRDNSILKDWLLYKLRIKIHDLIKDLNADSTIEELNFIITNIGDKKEKIHNKEIIFTQDGNNFSLTLRWQKKGTTEKFHIHSCSVQYIDSKILSDIIKDWYGIQIPYLQGVIILQAAGEKKDKFDPNLGEFGMLIDKYSEEKSNKNTFLQKKREGIDFMEYAVEEDLLNQASSQLNLKKREKKFQEKFINKSFKEDNVETSQVAKNTGALTLMQDDNIHISGASDHSADEI